MTEPMPDGTQVCPSCEVSAVQWREDVRSIDYGAGEEAVQIEVEVPVGRCSACEFEFIDWRGMEKTDDAVRRHLRALSGVSDDREAIDVLSNRFPVGALTLGADGAIAWEGTSRNVQESEPLAPVDTTGAGDAYAATFVIQFLESGDIKQANAEACKAAKSMLCDRLASTA